MLNRDIYAVVDLETTRTTSESGRIIQIAVAFVQNKKVINQFSTLVNPGEQIPRNITQLTGITQSMVKGAPFFEDVAMTLHAMLQGTIFVAHNVNFDLPFLNAEFERVGLTGLKSTALDTVPLSQILWPTAPGYRLVDMTNYLALEHSHPHQADSDALATADLLIAILNQAEGLPMLTLQTLADLPLVLPRATKTVFEKALAKNQAQPQPLPAHLQVIDGLALRRFSDPAPLVTGHAPAFPAKKAAKEQLYGKELAYREQQAKLMNAIYTHYTEAELSTEPGKTAFVAEAPTGMGKTLAYLLPYAYLADEQQKQVVVAVPTITLQQQVTDTINTTLKDILPFEVRGASLKGRTHYLNLQSFKRALRVDEGSTSLQFIKAQILVWLTETLSGDFDELNLINPQPDFMAKLSQPANNPAGSPYYGHEFSERQHVLAENAQFLVVNHAYLAEYAQELGTTEDSPYLVIDEAQNLPNAVLEQSRHQLPFQVWLTRVQNATNLILRDNDPSIGVILNRLVGGQQLKSRFLQQLEVLSSELPKLQVAFYRRFLLNGHTPATEGHYEVELPISELAQFWVDQGHHLTSMRHAVRDLGESMDYLLEQFSNTKDAFSLNERQHLADFRRLLESIAKYEQRLTTFQQDLVDFPDASVFWLTENQNHDSSNLRLSGGLLHTLDFFKDKVYPHFMPPTIVGATLFTSTKSGYLYDRLNIDRDTVFARRYPEVFDFKNQAELVMVENAPSPTDSGYVSYLAKQLVQLTTTVQENTLVLFNSLDTIQQVYNHMQSNQTWQQGNMTLLAQGVTGTRSKIMKRLQNESHMVVLGANSFWEGVDLPGDQLRMVVIARLPFDQPNSVLARAEEAVLMAHGKQPFYQSTLPKAVLRLRQGVGRLIRKPDDFGAVVIYDPRILTKSYGKTLRNMLPEEMPQYTLADNEVVPKVKRFFDAH
ncbi:helicase C-terminal domain-containing protein [Weissella confusa]|uniref:helicase C-terminal domain-containing protein n=1 Tax=Weissella confusa TaxID=1583 RepID=UPI0022E419FD|nr:helicase C-terminal domain-containing protein [Weissella confusa]